MKASARRYYRARAIAHRHRIRSAKDRECAKATDRHLYEVFGELHRARQIPGYLGLRAEDAVVAHILLQIDEHAVGVINRAHHPDLVVSYAHMIRDAITAERLNTMLVRGARDLL